MGILPLQYLPGESRDTLGLTGEEAYSIHGIAEGLEPGRRLTVSVKAGDGATKTIHVVTRIDTPVEIEYYRHGGILPFVLRQIR